MFEVFLDSEAGPYHRRDSLPNQDALLFHEERGIIFLAVADGAGSLKFSDVGSYAAVEAAVHSMTDEGGSLAPLELVELGMRKAREKLFAFENHKEYGATLALAVLKEDGSGAAAALGDSFIVIHGEDDSHSLVTGESSGEYANITELLTSAEIHPTYQEFSGAKAVSLSSDGLEGVAIQSGKAHGGFWDGVLKQAYGGTLDISKIFRWLSSLHKLVDDSTLLIALRR